MRIVGNLLLALGAIIGVLVAVGMLTAPPLHLPWLVVVGLTKLVLISSGGLIAAGAVCLRLANRADERNRLRALEGGQGEQLIAGDQKPIR